MGLPCAKGVRTTSLWSLVGGWWDYPVGLAAGTWKSRGGGLFVLDPTSDCRKNTSSFLWCMGGVYSRRAGRTCACPSSGWPFPFFETGSFCQISLRVARAVNRHLWFALTQTASAIQNLALDQGSASKQFALFRYFYEIVGWQIGRNNKLFYRTREQRLCGRFQQQGQSTQTMLLWHFQPASYLSAYLSRLDWLPLVFSLHHICPISGKPNRTFF